jgi:nicotinate-nucleotide adenylyltransferase
MDRGRRGSGSGPIPRPPRIGVFGGTFDPPHRGHVAVAADVADALGLDRVLWIPARVSPFKQAADATHPDVRLEMVRAAVAADPRFEADAVELERTGPSYTIDTLEDLRRRFPDAELHLIIGADQFEDFARWRAPEAILKIARLAVMNRGDAPAEPMAHEIERAVPGVRAATTFVPVRPIDVSSTDVRVAVGQGAEPDGLVPEDVARIIGSRGLYRT